MREIISHQRGTCTMDNRPAGLANKKHLMRFLTLPEYAGGLFVSRPTALADIACLDALVERQEGLGIRAGNYYHLATAREQAAKETPPEVVRLLRADTPPARVAAGAALHAPQGDAQADPVAHEAALEEDDEAATAAVLALGAEASPEDTLRAILRERERRRARRPGGRVNRIRRSQAVKIAMRALDKHGESQPHRADISRACELLGVGTLESHRAIDYLLRTGFLVRAPGEAHRYQMAAPHVPIGEARARAREIRPTARSVA